MGGVVGWFEGRGGGWWWFFVFRENINSFCFVLKFSELVVL